MGAVGIDLSLKEKQLEALFPMHTRDGVETFLKHYNHIKELIYYSGDYDALIMLVDFETAFHASNLTSIEAEVLHLVFVQDLKRVDVAKEIGVAKQTVQNWVNRALDKIAKYYEEVEGEQ